jgi:hypothetical protein
MLATSISDEGHYEHIGGCGGWSQGWRSISAAEARAVGSRLSMGVRKSASALASCRGIWYLSSNTAYIIVGFRV